MPQLGHQERLECQRLIGPGDHPQVDYEEVYLQLVVTGVHQITFTPVIRDQRGVSVPVSVPALRRFVRYSESLEVVDQAGQKPTITFVHSGVSEIQIVYLPTQLGGRFILAIEALGPLRVLLAFKVWLTVASRGDYSMDISFPTYAR